jgi:hypothetical protein
MKVFIATPHLLRLTNLLVERRSVVSCMLVAFMLTFVTAARVFAAAPQVRTQAPGFYRMMLGDFEITALLDGTHPFPDEEVLTKAASDAKRSKLFDINAAEADALLAAADLTAPTEGSINAFLINTGSRLVLIDSGAGTLYGASVVPAPYTELVAGI